jgi:hypothetical protein
MNDSPSRSDLARPDARPGAGRPFLYYRFTETRPAPPRLGPMAQPVGQSPKEISVGLTLFVDALPFKRPGSRP